MERRRNELIEVGRFDRTCPDVYGDAHPRALLGSIEEKGEDLLPLGRQHVLSISQFEPATLLQLFRLAAKFESNPQRYIRFNAPLTGKILINAFFEPSTRTRLSFDSAWHRLGGDTITITDRASTGTAKGESHADIAEMFNHYGDCAVLRDSDGDSIFRMAPSLRIPIINAGNGSDEHPTQAMADLYTILKWRPDLCRPFVPPEDRVAIGIVGLPNRMRTVRSLLLTLAQFPTFASEVVIFHDPGLDAEEVFDPGQREELEAAGMNLSTCTDLHSRVGDLDVIYINAIAWVGDSYETHGHSFRLHADLPLRPEAMILHPLARGEELDTSLDATPHNWYFSQARGAVFLRMALLTCMVERTERVLDVI
ncbi:MAG: aspartate carbamoyltransferase [Synechococcaceae cyanobacterium]|nr:aspartate carbamoyltransferase [Synechococcaceae cyanobacterium]